MVVAAAVGEIVVNPRAVPALLLLFTTACAVGRLEQERLPPAQLMLERWARLATVPDRILFHRDPAPGQWAEQRLGDVVVRWTVREAQADRWLVEQRIVLPQEAQVLLLELVCDAQGRVHKAQGWAQVAGKNRTGPLPLPLAPATPVVVPCDIASLPADAVLAGLPTRLATADGFSWWYAEGALFSLDLMADPSARWGLVQSTWGERLNQRLLGQGAALSAAAPGG